MKRLIFSILLLTSFFSFGQPVGSKKMYIQERVKLNWSNKDGIPYTQTFDANWGATAFAKISESETAYLCSNSMEIRFFESEKLVKKLLLTDWAQDFLFEEKTQRFYLLYKDFVVMINENGKELDRFPYPNQFPWRLELVNDNLFVLNADGTSDCIAKNSEKIMPITYKGWAAQNAKFIESIRENANEYSIIIYDSLNQEISRNKYHSDIELGAVRVLGANQTETLLDVENITRQVPVQTKRYLVSLINDGNKLNQIAVLSLPDLNYTFILRDFEVASKGFTFALSTPQNLRLFKLSTQSNKGWKTEFPQDIMKVNYHFNDHLLKEPELNFEEDKMPLQKESKGGPSYSESLFVAKPDESAKAMITRSAVMTNANAYLNFSWYCNSCNIKNYYCGSKTVVTPNWCASVGWKTAMPYMWGGFSSTSQFNTGMSNCKSAGDSNTSTTYGAPSCAEGLDCSGFVSRVWGLSTKQSTSGLNNYSTAYSSFYSLQQADIINKTVSPAHVRLVSSINGSGTVSCIEASTSQNKVHTASYSVGNLTNYVPRYGNNVTGSSSLLNDNACGAITIYANSSCSYTSGTNINATSSTYPSAPTSCTYYGGDVWYKVQVPSSGTVTIRTMSGSLTDAMMAIYYGSCSSMTGIVCEDDNTNGNGSAMPVVTISGYSVGTWLYIRVWGYSGASGTFSLCAMNYYTANKLAMTEIPEISTLSVSPNPVQQTLILYYQALTEVDAKISIVDMEGKTVFENMETVKKGKNDFNYDVSTLSEGVYNIILNNGRETLVEKVQVLK